MLTAKGFWTGRAPTQPADPTFPDGMWINATKPGARACAMDLEHPAPSVGHWLVSCDICGLTTVISAAGRADDPSGVTLACKAEPA